MKRQVYFIIASFLLLVPFRLLIGVSMVRLFNYLAQLSSGLPTSVLAPNVVLTKVIYNIALSCVTIYNIEQLSRKIKGRQALSGGSVDSCYWWTLLVGLFMLFYICFDAVTTYDLFFHITGFVKP